MKLDNTPYLFVIVSASTIEGLPFGYGSVMEIKK